MLNTVNLNDLFWTFQGEGFNAGRRALFVRLPFCNLSCSWCDTSFNTYTSYTFDEIKAVAESEKAKFAVITGGEPTMNKHTPLVIDLLSSLGFYLGMESNGTFAPPEGDYWYTVSPKREQKVHGAYYIHPDAYWRANEFKYVVDDQFDFSVLDRHQDNEDALLYLSPEFNQMSDNLKKIQDYIKENPEWKISLQTHKWMGIK